MVADQKTAFATRLDRIGAGKQFEHEDLVGLKTQKQYAKMFAEKSKRPKRTFMDQVMVLVAFLSGVLAVLLGRLAYFHLSKIYKYLSEEKGKVKNPGLATPVWSAGSRLLCASVHPRMTIRPRHISSSIMRFFDNRVGP